MSESDGFKKLFYSPQEADPTVRVRVITEADVEPMILESQRIIREHNVRRGLYAPA